MDFVQAAELKRYILKHFSTVLHIHDTCGGMYLSIDEPNEYVIEPFAIFPIGYPAEAREQKDRFDPARIRYV